MKSDELNEAVTERIREIRGRLESRRDPRGAWRGKLSSSALSTSVAVYALYLYDAGKYRRLIKEGVQWLEEYQNPDGGWGDTPDSPGNLSTTLLTWSALSVLGNADLAVRGAEEYIRAEAGGLDPEDIAGAVAKTYGNDRTFSAPILAMCALAGRLGDEKECWKYVPQLPFELALLPTSLFGKLRMQVVSYALPALIAVGLLKHSRKPSWNPLLRMTRNAGITRLIRKLEKLQPSNGGFLEAVPLCSFVALCLHGAGSGNTPVALKAVDFVARSHGDDGSWPIDSDLATWLTTLSICALPDSSANTEYSVEWLLAQQCSRQHPYTGAKPGGWAWTDLPGGVPDADDTSGALLALAKTDKHDPRIRESAELGVRWLLGLQNRDGGIPTFCRGWGRLRFDSSSPDISANALRAFNRWEDEFDLKLARKIEKASSGITEFLRSSQKTDGSWVPLWFGNQSTKDMANPVYGTSKVLLAMADVELERPGIDAMINNGVQYLLGVENQDGGWGGGKEAPSTLEETSCALEALARCRRGENEIMPAVRWILDRTDIAPEEKFPAAPVGLYFARLWYSEELYPVIFSLSALNAVKEEGYGAGNS